MAEQEGEVENAAALEMVEGRIVREISTALNGLEAGNVRVNMVKSLFFRGAIEPFLLPEIEQKSKIRDATTSLR